MVSSLAALQFTVSLPCEMEDCGDMMLGKRNKDIPPLTYREMDTLSKAHARVFRHRALPWLLWAEILLARIVHVLHQQTRNGSILDAFIVANWSKINPKLVAKGVKVVLNWLQNRCLASPEAPRSI